LSIYPVEESEDMLRVIQIFRPQTLSVFVASRLHRYSTLYQAEPCQQRLGQTDLWASAGLTDNVAVNNPTKGNVVF